MSELSPGSQAVINAVQAELDQCHQRIDELERELDDFRNRIAVMSVGNATLERENAGLKAQQNTLVSLIWETRWVSEDHDYQNLVGIAAEIRSGSLTGLNKETADRDQLRLQVARLREALEFIGGKTDHGHRDEPCPICLAVDNALAETPTQCASCLGLR